METMTIKEMKKAVKKCARVCVYFLLDDVNGEWVCISKKEACQTLDKFYDYAEFKGEFSGSVFYMGITQ